MMLNKLWNKINGKKTITGLIITGVGVCMFQVPFTAPAAPYVLSAGLSTLGVGATHKVIKSKNKE